MARRLKGTQADWVKARLLDGEALDHSDLIRACNGCGGWRLGAVVHKLRKGGWPVESRPLAGTGCEANPAVCYVLPPGWRPGGPVQLGLL